MHPSFRRAGPLVAAAALIAGCTEVLSDAQVGHVTSVLVHPDSSEVTIGAAAQLDAFPLDASGALRPGFTVHWASADPLIATVDDTGGVVGVGTGVVTITATTSGVQGMARVRVGPPPTIGLSGNAIQFDGEAGQPSPAAQAVTVTNTGGLTLTGLAVGVITYGAGAQNWIIASLDVTTAPATLTLTPITAGITTIGTYQATVPVRSTQAPNSPQNISVTLVMAPGPPTSHVITIFAGDNQTAAAGSTLLVNPAVMVADSFGNPVNGEAVTFQVAGGGGGILGGAALTNPSGIATVGSWTVQATGSVPANGQFINALQASAPSAGAVNFTARAYFSYAAHVHGIWASQGCTGCHGGLGGLTLTGTAAGVYTSALFNVPTTCSAGALIRVPPGGGALAEANSLMMLKLDHSAPAACPGGMPSNATFVPAAVRDTIRAWIRAGAPLN